MSFWALWLSAVLLIASGLAADVPFVFDGNPVDLASFTSVQLEQASSSSPNLSGVPPVTSPSGNEVLELPIVGGGSAAQGKTEKKVDDLKKTVNSRLEPDHSTVHEEALLLVAKFPGDLTIDQICSIYSYMKNGEGPVKGWSYARDPRGSDFFMYANQSLKIGGKANCSGVGDCDDFAILMSALVESIGGTTRIIFARNNTTGGHAYAEVYLGDLSDQNSQVNEIINWLKQKFNMDKIYTHIDTDTRDVWLNLDWGADEKGIAHPGGPYFQGDLHIVVFVRPFGNASLKLPETQKEEAEQPSPAIKLNITTDEIASKSAEVWFNKGFALSSLGKYEDAILAYEKAIQIDPQLVEAWNNKGIALGDLGRHEDAIEAYEKAIKLDAGFSAAWYNKGLALDAMGRSAEAIKAYDRVLKSDPRNAQAWINKANALNILGRYDEALQACNKAIEIDPNDVNAWGNKAWALGGLGLYEDTLTACDKAIELNPEDVIAWNNKAATLISLERYSRALDACNSAITLDPQYVNAWVNKGRALEALGRSWEADAAFAKVWELGYSGWNR